MQAFSLCQKHCPDKIPVTPSNQIGFGADGDVYNIKGQSKRVVKFSVIYDPFDQDIYEIYERVNSILSFIKKNKPVVCARVYDHAFLGEGSRKTVHGIDQKYLLYYYTMEKLYKTSEDERKVFHTIMSHEDRGIVKNYHGENLRKVLAGLRLGLDFDEEKVILFNNNLRKSPLRHLDVHVRNIMKTKGGNYRLIDFDRMEIGVPQNG